MTFAERLTALRTATGMSQDRVALLADIGRTIANKLEGGANKGTSHAVRVGLAAAFDLDVRDLDAYFAGELPLEDVLARRRVRAREDERARVEPRYASRSRWLRWAHDLRFPESVIAEVAAMRLDSSDDPGDDFWIETLRDGRARVRRAAKIAGRAAKQADLAQLAAPKRGRSRARQ